MLLLSHPVLVLLHEYLPMQLEEAPHRLQANESRRLGEGYFVKLLSPGEDYNHMTLCGFATHSSYNLGFKNGGRKHYDSDGQVTLEYFSKILERMHNTVGIEEATPNCP